MKKNGFTLIELLSVLVILGIISTIAIQTYNVLIKTNDETKYTYYYDLVKLGADLYLESRKNYLEDGSCYSVKYSTLVERNLVKEEGVVCEGTLLLSRSGKKFTYDDALLACKTKEGKVLKEKGTTTKVCTATD